MSHPVNIAKIKIIPEMTRIGEAISTAGGRPVLVGGWVRDVLMGIEHTKDFDLEVFGLTLPRLRDILKPFGYVHSVGKHFGVLKLRTKEAEYDISVPRRESNIGKGHKGFWVETDPDMPFEEAASRRDFTINSMGYAFLEQTLLDPFAGRHDLERNLLRNVGPAFGEDPLRVLRAMQFSARFGLSISPETLAICREQDLGELPRERIFEEFKKLLLRSPHPSQGLRYAGELGVLGYFPELEAVNKAPAMQAPTSIKTNKKTGGKTDGKSDGNSSGAGVMESQWLCTLAVLDQSAKRRAGDANIDLVLMLASLCLKMGDPPATGMGGLTTAETGGQKVDETGGQKTAKTGELPEAGTKPMRPSRGAADKVVKSFLGRLTNSGQLMERVLAMLLDVYTPENLYHAHQTGQIAPGLDETGINLEGEVRRLSLRISLPFLLKLAESHHAAVYPNQPFAAGQWLARVARQLGVWEAPPEPLLLGRHLLDKGLPPGRIVGNLVKAAFEKQLDGEITTLAQAKDWAREKLKDKSILDDRIAEVRG